MKSKQPKSFETEDGRMASFSYKNFRAAIKELRSYSDPDNPGKRITNKVIFQKIAIALWGICSDEIMQDHIDVIKQWYYGNNGPSNVPEDIYKMAECLGFKRDQFVEYREKRKKEVKTTTENNKQQEAAITLSAGHFTNDIIQAMQQTKSQEEAYKLHAEFLDLIAAYNKADMDTWLSNEPLSPEWITAAKKYPSRCPMELAVQKSSFYLSRDLRNRLFVFLEDMYGVQPNDWYEINQIHDDLSALSHLEDSDFISNKLERFAEYLSMKEIDATSLDTGERENWMFNFLQDESADRYYELERIFEEYIVE